MPQVDSRQAGHPTDTGPAPAVRITNLNLTIDERPVLRQINLDIPAGSFTALLGHNGAGKSTLLHVLAGLRRGYRGRVELFGHNATQARPALRARIGLIGHQPMVYRDLSAAENLMFFGRLYGLADPLGRTRHLLEQVNLLDRATDPVKTFSRGMLQRLSIARALLHEPPLLLADEPFSGLDLPSALMLEQLLARLVEQGKTVILAHHDIAQALGLARRLVLLKAGRIVLDQPSDRLSVEQIRKEVLAG